MKWYIENQEAFVNTYFGKYPISYNGCGPIAVYNLLEYLDEINSSTAILRSIIRYKIPTPYFGGKYGLMPWQMSTTLKNLGLYYTWHIINKNKVCEKIQENTKSVHILFIFDNGPAHYMFVDQNCVPHNACNRSLNEWCTKSPFMYCILFEIRIAE